MEHTPQDINRLISTMPEQDKQKISDGHHTFCELYDHRCVLFITLCRSIHIPQMRSISSNLPPRKKVWRSRKNAEGQESEGWFIMGISEMHGSIISYHLPEKFWNATSFVPEIPKAYYDGHVSEDVINRLNSIPF